ncbi:hypothetical protein Fmac_029285 [Flemingia macrophylla]|uniref:Uncharacterized protein n=1 Tax=Flemingia macrophylla TaxID=520843 RepID=A0ABD1LA30_9FABA
MLTMTMTRKTLPPPTVMKVALRTLNLPLRQRCPKKRDDSFSGGVCQVGLQNVVKVAMFLARKQSGERLVDSCRRRDGVGREEHNRNGIL